MGWVLLVMGSSMPPVEEERSSGGGARILWALVGEAEGRGLSLSDFRVEAKLNFFLDQVAGEDGTHWSPGQASWSRMTAL